MKEPCWEKCEQLIKMLLLFVPVLNILDKGLFSVLLCVTLLCIWMYLLMTWSFGWALAGKFFLTDIVFLFHNRRNLTLLRKDNWSLSSVIMPIIIVTTFLSKHSFDTNDILYKIYIFSKKYKFFSKCSGSFDIDLMVGVSDPWGKKAVCSPLIFYSSSCFCYLHFSSSFLNKDEVAVLCWPSLVLMHMIITAVTFLAQARK